MLLLLVPQVQARVESPAEVELVDVAGTEVGVRCQARILHVVAWSWAAHVRMPVRMRNVSQSVLFQDRAEVVNALPRSRCRARTARLVPAMTSHSTSENRRWRTSIWGTPPPSPQPKAPPLANSFRRVQGSICAVEILMIKHP